MPIAHPQPPPNRIRPGCAAGLPRTRIEHVSADQGDRPPIAGLLRQSAFLLRVRRSTYSGPAAFRPVPDAAPDSDPATTAATPHLRSVPASAIPAASLLPASGTSVISTTADDAGQQPQLAMGEARHRRSMSLVAAMVILQNFPRPVRTRPPPADTPAESPAVPTSQDTPANQVPARQGVDQPAQRHHRRTLATRHEKSSLSDVSDECDRLRPALGRKNRSLLPAWGRHHGSESSEPATAATDPNRSYQLLVLTGLRLRVSARRMPSAATTVVTPTAFQIPPCTFPV